MDGTPGSEMPVCPSVQAHRIPGPAKASRSASVLRGNSRLHTRRKPLRNALNCWAMLRSSSHSVYSCTYSCGRWVSEWVDEDCGENVYMQLAQPQAGLLQGRQQACLAFDTSCPRPPGGCRW